jgi:methionine biosynthesis protein MetW
MRAHRSKGEYWDRLWEGKDHGLLWKHVAAASLVDVEPVLDVGCGRGVMLELLRSEGKERSFGCDISWTSAQLLSERGLKVVCCDADGLLPFRDGSFGTVTLVDVLEHFFDPAQILLEACRVAEQVVIVVPNFNSVAARYRVLFGRVPENNTSRKRHAYWFNQQTLEKLLVSLNLPVIDRLYQPFKSGDFLLSAPFNLLARVRPQLFSLSFAVKIEARGAKAM